MRWLVENCHNAPLIPHAGSDAKPEPEEFRRSDRGGYGIPTPQGPKMGGDI